MSDAASRLSETEMAELCALADGSLPLDRRAAVEARVAASPELQVILERQRRSVLATQALADEPMPASLPSAVDAGRRKRRTLRPVRRVAIAGALALVLAVVASVVLTSGPGTPTVAEAARFASDAPTGPAPPRGDGTTLGVGVEGVAFPDLLQAYGWRAVGVHRGEVGGRDATTVVYEKGERRIAYAIVAGDGLPRPSGVGTTVQGVSYQALRVDGRPVVTWRRDGHTCVLVGDSSHTELLTLASY